MLESYPLYGIPEFREAVRQLLVLRPCHITGMHAPGHHLVTTCSDQKSAMLDELLVAIGLSFEELPRALHGNCYWCREVPSQEVFRERLRQTYRWAGLELTAELAESAPDAPRQGDLDLILARIGDEWVPWAQVVRELEDEIGVTTVASALQLLLDSRTIERDAARPYTAVVRRRQEVQADA